MSDDMKEPQDAGPSPYGDAPADETATSFDADALSHPIASSGMEAGPTPPENIGRYRVVRQLGEGGFGTVYLAEQSEPVRRKVAIKIIKPGMSTKGVIARFEAERQALAMMDHPCVARVFDAGVTDEPGGGRPYFVMEYVAGVPITEHCDRGKLPVTDRLELFMQVCEAVQHAHQKGIIHRDLKPSNMLITTIDGKAAPRVIDFGIAKALHQKLTDETMCTEVGQIIGTREYMSPEQAETGSIDIDTRSDIYALGVLLYELLAGWRPFESDTLRKAGQAEIQRILREVDPPRPSTRLTTRASTSTRDAEVAAQIASTRQTDLRSLTSMLRSDLDWVVMKCLEKDRERRYESASALAGELERFLKNEPVLAGPPSVGYRFGKFARRNRIAMTAAAVILLALVGATAVSTGFAIKTNLALADRDAALDAERTQRSLAEKRETEANAARAAETLRAAELEQVAGFQASQLGGVDPDGMGVAFRLGLRGKLEALARRRGLASDAITALLDEYDLVVAGADFTGLALQTLDSQVFQPALASIERQFATQPRVRSRLLQAIATAMFEAGLWEAATAPQEEALALRRAEFGSEHADTLHSLQQTANLWRERGDHARARSMYDEVLQTRRRVLGEEHVDTITSLASIGGLDLVEGDLEQAAERLNRALVMRRRLLGDDDASTLSSIHGTGTLLLNLGRHAEAADAFHEAYEGRRVLFGEAAPATLSSLDSLGYVLTVQQEHARAEPFVRSALELRRAVLGDDHPATLRSVGSMATLLQSSGDAAAAERFFREMLEQRRRLLGATHIDTLIATINMGSVLDTLDRFDEAEAHYREALTGLREVSGDESLTALGAMNNLGHTLKTRGRLDEAEPFYREVLAGCRRLLPADHPNTLITLNNLAYLLEARGDLEAALPFFQEALDGRRRSLRPDHPMTLESINRMGAVQRTMGDLGAALSLGAEAVAGADREMPVGHLFTGWFRLEYARTLAALGRFGESDAVTREAGAILQEAAGVTPQIRSGLVEHAVSLYEAWHAADPSGGHEEQAAAWRDKRDAAIAP